MIKKSRLAILISVLMVFILATPAYAIVNPDNIAFGTGTIPLYKVFEGVVETGDMLFMAEGYVDYTVIPTDYTAREAFLFEVLNTTGTVVLLSTPLKQYGDRPISIYQTAAQVTAAGLVSGTAYGLRITGNPLIFASPVGNTVTAYLGASDFIDQSGATDSNNPLRIFSIDMAENIEAEDAPAAGFEYITDIQGVRYLTILGGDIFLEGVPGLSTYCSILFQAAVEKMSGDAQEATGAYADSLNPTIQWGSIAGNGLTNLGIYLGITQALAGSTLMLVIVMFFAVFLYKKTESGVAVLLMIAVTPFMGAWLGLMSLAIAFIFVIFIVVLLGYFFFSRGAL
ncbi:hypothetical protein LCGC14_0341370 [marine sediment metagenome]|uniref:Uncharacterized protein n=1 Tax=marine sediment metagenome TaxID=412755 RepID=A0A0F9TDN3_9ZZZZ